MRKMLLLLTVLLLTALLSGCNNDAPSSQSSTEGAQSGTIEQSERKSSSGVVTAVPGNGANTVNMTKESTDGSNKPVTGVGENVGQPEDDLLIKSENQVIAGSGQQTVKALDKELDSLVDTINNLDTIQDSDLME